jgi:hypothetical protein
VHQRTGQLSSLDSLTRSTGKDNVLCSSQPRAITLSLVLRALQSKESTNTHKDGSWRTLHVSSGQTGMSIYCRPFFYSVTNTFLSQYDPWRTSGVSSQFRPGGELESTPQHPVQIIPGGFHCSDLRLSNAAANAGVQKVVDNEVKQIVEWTAEYYNQTSSYKSYGRRRRH